MHYNIKVNRIPHGQGPHTAQMIQGDSGATLVEGCGLVPRGQDNPPAVPHRILWLFTEKGTNPGPNVANCGRVPAVEGEISIIAY